MIIIKSETLFQIDKKCKINEKKYLIKQNVITESYTKKNMYNKNGTMIRRKT